MVGLFLCTLVSFVLERFPKLCCPVALAFSKDISKLACRVPLGSGLSLAGPCSESCSKWHEPVSSVSRACDAGLAHLVKVEPFIFLLQS